jgi:hypothetical protein
MGYHRTYTGKPSASITLSLYLTGIEPFSGIWSYNLGSFFYVFQRFSGFAPMTALQQPLSLHGQLLYTTTVLHLPLLISTLSLPIMIHYSN